MTAQALASAAQPARHHPAALTAVYMLAAVLAIGFAMPAVQAIGGETAHAPAAVGDIAALMVYLLAAPVSFQALRRPAARAGALLVVTVAALAADAVTVQLEMGALGSASGMVILVLALGLAAGQVIGTIRRRRRRAVEQVLDTAVAALQAATTEVMASPVFAAARQEEQARYRATAELGRHLVAALLWQASVESDTAAEMRTSACARLASLRRDLMHSTDLDADGLGAALVTRVLQVLDREPA